MPILNGNYVFFVKKFQQKRTKRHKKLSIISFRTKVSSFGLDIPSNFAA